MPSIDLGIVYEPHPAELAELGKALAELTGAEPEKEKVFSYAGPNEVVQLLLDSATWQNALSAIAIVFGGKFAASFASELGKLAAAEVWKEKANYYDALKLATAAPFLRIVRAIQALRAKDQTVTIAVKIPDTPRNAGLVITSDDPAEIAWQIANIARCAEDVRRVIVEATQADPSSRPLNGPNPDMSIVVEVLESGDVRVLGVTIKK